MEPQFSSSYYYGHAATAYAHCDSHYSLQQHYDGGAMDASAGFQQFSAYDPHTYSGDYYHSSSSSAGWSSSSSGAAPSNHQQMQQLHFGGGMDDEYYSYQVDGMGVADMDQFGALRRHCIRKRLPKSKKAAAAGKEQTTAPSTHGHAKRNQAAPDACVLELEDLGADYLEELLALSDQ
ncbi:ethylene-responsive transcription factor 1-like [Panicum miliaceum]|uniref:Ethylene-responsive transcription factor 1-like n=1 Tax=Panicum miliaceum TaxID=4540 RepID=A0A3L6QPZ9_PANMI|nr:ethylene-responsive transcription factor 1-like [Panicum miliaceum]